MSPVGQDAVPGITQAFHEAYERMAPEFGYKTREASAVPWVDVPRENKRLMEATVRTLIANGTIAIGQVKPGFMELAKALKRLVNARLPKTTEPEESFWVACRNARATLDSTHWMTGINGEQDADEKE